MIQYCINCLNFSSRPRISFSQDGRCNACIYHEHKHDGTINWQKRWQRLIELCNEHRRRNEFDVLVPCSGGKDGSYTAWMLKNHPDLRMHPLCVTFSPPIQTELGRRNLENFRNSGFDLVEIRPNPEIYRRLCRRMFIEQARCKFPFVIGIGTAIAREALLRNIPLCIYGEEGETEYGGSDKFENSFFLNAEYMKIYHENHDMTSYLDEFTEQELSWWIPPPIEEMKKLRITWWSKFESWDDKLHADLAIKKCGLKAQDTSSIGTFTATSQIDDILQDLHMYECFIKYGTGRATADCNLAIKGGRMTRKEAVEYVNKHEGTFPLVYLDKFLDYFEMTEPEFWKVIDKHANKDLLVKTSKVERPYILKEPVK